MSKEEQALISAAIEAFENAYAPYSKFQVGAALLSKSGKIFLGVNVENASYPLTVCAERSAISNAVSNGEREFTAIAIATKHGGAPCGACRQVLREFAPLLPVLLCTTGGEVVKRTTIAELLPHSFGPEDL